MLRRLAEHPGEAGEDLSSLRAVVSSAAPLSDVTARACTRRFGTRVITVYGSSDGVNCHTARTGTGNGSGAGRPDPTVAEIRVVDELGRDAEQGEPGEIWARGPMTPLSHVAAPELDARRRSAIEPGSQIRAVLQLLVPITSGGSGGIGEVTSTLRDSELSARLAADPIAVAPEKAEFENRVTQTIGAYGSIGIEQRAILMYMDAGLPVGTLFDKRPPEEMARDLQTVTKQLANYPAFRGWSWAASSTIRSFSPSSKPDRWVTSPPFIRSTN